MSLPASVDDPQRALFPSEDGFSLIESRERASGSPDGSFAGVVERSPASDRGRRGSTDPRHATGVRSVPPATWPRKAFELGLIVLALSGCGAPRVSSPSWNVVVVMVDTLRADRLSTYGYERETDPFLRSFAQRGLVFERAYSQAGCTFPSVNSLFTSRSPQLFTEAIERHGMAIPPDVPTLAELLREDGYATAAASASVIVRATPSDINHQGGFDAGFDRFDESCEEKRAPCLNERAGELLDTLEPPFFLYLHYLEPHGPYRPPRWHEPRFATGRPDRQWVARGELERVYRSFFDDETEIALDERDFAHLRDLYDEEIRFFDARFEELVEELAARGLMERTLIVLLSDHGEELGEHGRLWGHCRDLAYENVVRTPLVLWLPGGPSGRRQALVENTDVLPTLLELLGLEHAVPAEIEGVSLLPVIRDDAAVRPHARSAQGTSRILTDGRFKIWWGLESENARLFDLEVDPSESEDLSAQRADLSASLAAALHEWMAAVEEPGGAQRARRLEEELRALGYL